MAWLQSLAVALLLVLRSCTATPTRHACTNEPHVASWYAIGFDLTESYGTASVRTSNGDAFPVARVDGDETYLAVMKRLGLDSSRHMCPPYEYWHDGGVGAGWTDIPRQQLRWVRKSLGLPATDDVGVISKMMSTLHSETVGVLARDGEVDGQGMNKAVIARPDLVALYDEDVQDAAEHAGLDVLSDEWFERQPPHGNAYLSAYGLASELSLAQLKHLNRSNNATHMYSFVSAHLTREALEIQCEARWTNQTCSPRTWSQHRGYFSAELGAGLHDEMGVEWKAQVASLVQRCVRTELDNPYRANRNVSDVLFAGESGSNKAFQRTVLDAIEDVQPGAKKITVWPKHSSGLSRESGSLQQPVQVSSLDHSEASVYEFGGSIGAANMAWEILQSQTPKDAKGDDCYWTCRFREDATSEIRY